MKAFRALAAILLFVHVVVAAPAKSEAASAAEIDAGGGATLRSFERQFPGAARAWPEGGSGFGVSFGGQGGDRLRRGIW